MNETLKDWLIVIGILLIIYTLIDRHRDEAQIEDKIFELVNNERSKVGSIPLMKGGYLGEIAKEHSNWMMETGSFEHSSYNVGENVAMSPIYYWTEGCGITITNNQVASCIVKSWIGSSGHYDNMISFEYIKTGIGVACNIFSCKATQTFE